MAHRPLVYDLTHLVTRLSAHAPSGIDRVDLMFGRYLIESDRMAAGTHCTFGRPNILSPSQARSLVRRAAALWREHEDGADDPGLGQIVRWLNGEPQTAPALQPARPSGGRLERLRRAAFTTRYRLTFQLGRAPPRDALYLNVTQYLLEFPIFFRWLDRRPDVRSVFFLHDLLPLDYPEYFRPQSRGRFDRRIATIARHAAALLVASEAVAARAAEEMKRRTSRTIPIHVAPLPSSVAVATGHASKPVVADVPYFMMVGTIEPRKNHLLLLHVWRKMSRSPGRVPRLLIVGSRGWENEQVLDLLDRSPNLTPHVLEVSGLPVSSLRDLIAGARALLLPSFDEGFGLPIVEALSLGTPVIASDIPVFREVSGGCATFLDPIDGPAWLAAIQVAAAGPPREAVPATRQGFDRHHGRAEYFANVTAFLDSV